MSHSSNSNSDNNGGDVVLRIRPEHPVGDISMDRISLMMSPMTVSCALLFEGGAVDILRLETALRKIGNYCPYLFSGMLLCECAL